MKELILGGVRSGKSRLAEQRAQESGLDVVYVATATAGDDEMRGRIEEHRKQRHARWLTIEEPRALAQVVREHARELEAERASLLTVVQEVPGHLIIVSNETGLGIVPIDALSRRFSEEAGLLHQDLTSQAVEHHPVVGSAGRIS